MSANNKQSSAVYLAHLEFNIGEYGQHFYLCIPANSIRDTEKRLNRYLRDYYWDTDIKKSSSTYYFFGGEVAVKWTEIEKLPSCPQEAYRRLVHMLSI